MNRPVADLEASLLARAAERRARAESRLSTATPLWLRSLVWLAAYAISSLAVYTVDASYAVRTLLQLALLALMLLALELWSLRRRLDAVVELFVATGDRG